MSFDLVHDKPGGHAQDAGFVTEHPLVISFSMHCSPF
jgi:hypothetical protein